MKDCSNYRRRGAKGYNTKGCVYTNSAGECVVVDDIQIIQDKITIMGINYFWALSVTQH